MNWSASSVPRLLQCATSALLPQHDYRTTYAEEGQDHHADLEAAIDVGDENAIPEHILSLVHDGDEMITEKSFAYDVITDTARELPPGRARRDYSGLGPNEIPGTPDLIIRGAGRVIVVDHKSFEEVDDADRNTQAATYALMIARAWECDEVDVSISYRAPWRRPSYATLNAIDLAVHADRLVKLREDIETARVNPQAFVNDGAWCKYCPSFWGGCPRVESLRRRVANGELVRRAEELIPFANDDEATAAFDLRQRLKMFLTRLDAALYARASERPISTPDGKLFGPREKEGKRKIDADRAYALIREKYGQQVADSAVQRTVAQTWIEKALKEHGVKSAAKARDSIVKQLEDAGAVKRDTKTVIEVYDPTRALKESA